jgi:hypothetical protein
MSVVDQVKDEDLDLDQEQEQEELNSDVLDMSDEEFAKLDLSAVAQLQAPVEEPAAAPVTEEEEEDDQGTEQEAKPEPDTKTDEEESVSGKESEVPAAPAEEPKNKPASDEPVQPVDHKAIVDKLFAPFKANGKEMAVDNVDDAVALMQMGANYNKKMAALKPNLKLLKLLENNNLLSEEKLSFLIDLDKKNPAAISKLLKDSGIDPLDVDVEKANEYAPKPYTVDEREIELDTVLEEIQDTPVYAKTVNVVSNKWDAASKQVVANNPQLLKVINDHMASGVYDLINSEIERERMFGRLNGLSDIEAYRQVGDSIQARNGFAHLFKQQAPVEPVPVKEPVPTPAPAHEPDLRDKKRAASSPKPAAPVAKQPEFNPLALSDEEFAKLVNPKYM